MRHRTRSLKHRPRNFKPGKGPLSSRGLLELSLFSTFIFVFTALLLQFLLTLLTALFLKSFSITFLYSLFAINYLTESSSNWPDEQVLLIFGTGPVIITTVGFLLLLMLRRLTSVGWKTKLFLTWMSFLMVNALPCGLIAGVFFYEGFGVAFHWLAGNDMVRGLIALLVLMGLIVFSRFWQRMFLKTAYTSVFLDSLEHQKTFIKNIFFKPWMFGLVILLLYNWPFSNFFWRAFLLSFGYMALALFDNNTRMHRKPHIRKSDKKIFTTRYQPLWFALLLALIWVADYIIINF